MKYILSIIFIFAFYVVIAMADIDNNNATYVLDFDTELEGIQGPEEISWTKGENYEVDLILLNANNIIGVNCDIAFNNEDIKILMVHQKLGDSNFDGISSLNDLAILGRAYGSCVGDNYYKISYDLNRDGCIDILEYSAHNSGYEQTSKFWTDAQEYDGTIEEDSHECFNIYDPVSVMNENGIINDLATFLLRRPGDEHSESDDGNGLVLFTIRLKVKDYSPNSFTNINIINPVVWDIDDILNIPTECNGQESIVSITDSKDKKYESNKFSYSEPEKLCLTEEYGNQSFENRYQFLLDKCTVNPDFNNDGLVDSVDLFLIYDYFHSVVGQGDLSGDGLFNAIDIAIFAANWHKTEGDFIIPEPVIPTNTPTFCPTNTPNPTSTSTITPIGSPIPTVTPTPLPTFPSSEIIECLILFYTDRMNNLGYSSEDVDKLRELVGNDLAPMVDGYFIEVGNRLTNELANSYKAWDNTRADLLLGNDLGIESVNQANTIVENLKVILKDILDNELNGQSPKYLLIVGGDEVFPFYRHKDNTDTANQESNYSMIDSHYSVGCALKENYFLSDDYYGSIVNNFETVLESNMDLQDLILGRLVETPNEILISINRFIENNGIINITREGEGGALIAGSDWFRDAATRIGELSDENDLILCDAYTIDPTSPEVLYSAMNETIGVVSKQPFQLHFIGLHSDHINTYLSNRMLDKISVNEFYNNLSDETLSGDLVFHLGSHSGLEVPSGYNQSDGLDHPQLFLGKGCAAYISQTSFSGASGNITEFSEKIAIRFWYELLLEKEKTVGEAILEAKRRYLLEDRQPSVSEVENFELNIGEDEKVVLNTVLYGFPMTKIYSRYEDVTKSNFNRQIISKGNTFKEDNIIVNQFSLQFPDTAFNEINTSKGTYYDLDNNVLSNSNEPVMPYISSVLSIGNNIGRIARGTVFLGGMYHTQTNFDPVIEKSYWLPGDTEDVEGTLSTEANEAWFPPIPISANTIKLDRRFSNSSNIQKITWVAGQYKDNDRSFRLYNSLNTESYWLLESEDRTLEKIKPEILSIDTSLEGNKFSINIETSEDILKAYFTYTTGLDEWNSLALNSGSDERHWGAELTLSEAADYILQVVDKNGNVSINSNRGRYYRTDGTPLPTPTLTQTSIPNTPTITPTSIISDGNIFDIDHDKTVTFQDLLILIEAMNETDYLVDFNSDGLLDSKDLFLFTSWWKKDVEIVHTTPTATPEVTSTPTMTHIVELTPTSTPTSTPSVLPDDNFEPDDTYEQANLIELNSTQENHSISKSGDIDWVKFILHEDSYISIETLGSEGDTILSLYDSEQNEIARNDDGDINLFSKIFQYLLTGDYYAKVESFDSESLVSDYTISLESVNYSDVSPLRIAIDVDADTPGIQTNRIFSEPPEVDQYIEVYITISIDDPGFSDWNTAEINFSIKGSEPPVTFVLVGNSNNELGSFSSIKQTVDENTISLIGGYTGELGTGDTVFYKVSLCMGTAENATITFIPGNCGIANMIETVDLVGVYSYISW